MRAKIRVAQKGIKWPRNGKWPPPYECVKKFSRAIAYLQKHPHTRWPPEVIKSLKSLLLPVIEALWPDGPPSREKENN